MHRTGTRSHFHPAWFSRAGEYPGRAVRSAVRVRDPVAAFPLDPPESERLLQAVWFDDALRPDALRTADGEAVGVETPGTWNLGPGPDFLGAAAFVGPDRRRVMGDVEIHVRPADWTAHGHAGDARYRNVRFHVTFSAGPPPRAPLPPGALRIALRDPLARDPSFSFECIDPAAYPYAARRTPCPCGEALADWSALARERLLDAAGEERLRRKTERFRTLADERGIEQACYEEMMAALGYRNNKAAFRRLAETVPLHLLREEARDAPRTAYALLAGVSGLLPGKPRDAWDSETREELRATWDAWWKHRRRWSRFLLPEGIWRKPLGRPANHPVRRLLAAAHWFTRPRLPHEALALAARKPATLVPAFRAWLDAPAEGYWSRRLTWGGRLHPRPCALVGRARATAVFNNVAVPLLALTQPARPAAHHAGHLLDALPAESDNALIRATAHVLFGPDHPPSLYRSGLRRQGLLQLFHDYCLRDRTACATCPLPGYLHSYRVRFHGEGAVTGDP